MKRRSIVRNLARLLAPAILIAGVAGTSFVVSADTAGAVACGTPVSAGITCTGTGTLHVNASSLTLITPASLSWSSLLNGTPQTVVDTNTADQQATVEDSTGSGGGWKITVAATTFTNGAATLPNVGTLSMNGSVSSSSSTSIPSFACVVVSTCVLPVPEGAITYPLLITTAPTSPTPVEVGDATVGTGLGQILIGGSSAPNPIAWWVNVPATALAGNYVSTFSATVVSGP